MFQTNGKCAKTEQMVLPNWIATNHGKEQVFDSKKNLVLMIIVKCVLKNTKENKRVQIVIRETFPWNPY